MRTAAFIMVSAWCTATLAADYDWVWYKQYAAAKRADQEFETWFAGVVSALNASSTIWNDKRNRMDLVLCGLPYPRLRPEDVKRLLERKVGTLTDDRWSNGIGMYPFPSGLEWTAVQVVYEEYRCR